MAECLFAYTHDHYYYYFRNESESLVEKVCFSETKGGGTKFCSSSSFSLLGVYSSVLERARPLMFIGANVK